MTGQIPEPSPSDPLESGPRAALKAIGQLPDTEIDIADAAIQLARVDHPEGDWQAARVHLSVLARDAAKAAAGVAANDGAGRAQALADMFTRHGYRGDIEGYDEPANANLIQVIERRRGLPVALGVLWLHCAGVAGWQASGLDFPGHFLLGMQGKGAQTVVDVFSGGTRLAASELRALIKRVEGPEAELRPGVLQPMTNRAVLLRLQNNIKSRRLQARDLPGALTCAEDMLLIAPEAAVLWREAALLHKRLEHVSAALACFEHFLTLVPQGEAARLVRSEMDELRTRLN